MNIVTLNGVGAPSPTALALGMFDGVHLGHRRIITAAKNISTELGISASVLIFSSSPHGAAELLPLSDRLKELQKAGADYAYIFEFEELKNMSAEDFVSDVLREKIGAKTLVAGYNYRFGKGGAGDGEALLRFAVENGMTARICEKAEALGDAISSTRIRKLLMEGDVERANTLLGYEYYLRAPVVHGKALGRTLGLPTVNQTIDAKRVKMAHGIYYTKTYIDGKEYLSVSNLGARPTVCDGEEVNLETHILDFEGDIYGKEIKVAFFGRGREESRFDSVEELRSAVMLDCERAREFFKGK